MGAGRDLFLGEGAGGLADHVRAVAEGEIEGARGAGLRSDGPSFCAIGKAGKAALRTPEDRVRCHGPAGWTRPSDFDH